MNEIEQKRIDRATSHAMHEFLKARCLAILIGPTSAPRSIGTGTCFHASGRFFVATAAHVVLKVPVEEIWLLHVRRGHQTRVPIERVIASGGGDYDTIDLALLELTAQAAASIGREFVSPASFGDPPQRAREALTHVFGYPWDLIDQDRVADGEFHFGGVSWATLHVEPSSFPDRADAEFDVAFDYSEHGVVGVERVPLRLPRPGGFSGASIWALNPNLARPLVGPQNARWIGIQRAWVPERRIAYGNRVSLLDPLLSK